MDTKMIGGKIALARKNIHLSQAQLAARLYISPQAVGKWERGESVPDIHTMGKLAAILGVDLNYFSESTAQADPGIREETGSDGDQLAQCFVPLYFRVDKQVLPCFANGLF